MDTNGNGNGNLPEPRKESGIRKHLKPALNPERADKIIALMELRRQGLSYQACGEAYGCSGKTAWKWITRGLHESVVEASEDTMKLELMRYDSYLSVADEIVREGKTPDQRLRALDRAMAISERRAKLLGLDAPIRTEATLTMEVLDAEIAQKRRELSASGIDPDLIIDVEEVDSDERME